MMQSSGRSQPAQPRAIVPARRRAHRTDRRTVNRQGSILLVVLIVVAMLALSAYTFSEMMLTHYESTQYSGKQVQARYLVNSGADAARWFLTQPEQIQLDSGGIYDNPAMFQAQLVAPHTDPRHIGTFSILAPIFDSYGNIAGVRYGFEDESARLNLNLLLIADTVQENGGRTLLMTLPGMTEEIADSILDWIDEDDEPRDYGIERDYYEGLTPPYSPTNGPLRSVEELLLVRGVTPDLMFGLDTNRNGLLDPHETGTNGGTVNGVASTTASTTTAGVGDISRGWAPYLTLYSAEKNYNSQGFPRVFVNQEDLALLYDELLTVIDAEWANFIVAYRLYGPYEGNEEGESAAGFVPDTSGQARSEISQLLDLVDAKVQVPGEGGGGGGTVLRSPIESIGLGLYLPPLFDNCTAVGTPMVPGRININQAPAALIAGIPGMDEELYTAILENRVVNPDEASQNPNMAYETWILTEGFLFDEDGQPDIARMKQLSPFICAGGDVHRAQIVGYYQGGAVSSRAEIVIDNTDLVPRIVFWRDLSHLGRGFPLEALGISLSGGINQNF